MQKLKKSQPRAEQQKAQLAKWCESQGRATGGSASPPGGQLPTGDQDPLKEEADDGDSPNIDAHQAAEMDHALQNAWMTGTDEAFSQLLYYFLSDNVPGHFCSCGEHISTQCSDLCASAGHCRLVTQNVIPKSDAWGSVAEQDLTAVERETLDLYLRSVSDDQTDLDLLLALLQKVHASSQEGK
ncbi:hypothetical protein V5799_004115 [Amblyomma americanum]|uniref:Uncharacterized protein n=1 Tax=Amblyomma americanum TaxID=6943 RepID=A0AAQ4D715_AMBAM